jgi:hypothetical protein
MAARLADNRRGEATQSGRRRKATEEAPAAAQPRRMGARGWLVVYIVAALVFALIMVWITTSKPKNPHVRVAAGSGRLEIVDGYMDVEHQV